MVLGVLKKSSMLLSIVIVVFLNSAIFDFYSCNSIFLFADYLLRQ